MNATLNRADSAAIRMSLPRVNASPPPDAAPFTAAMIGCGCRRKRGIRSAMYCCTFIPACGRPSPSLSGIATPSLRSSPAQNDGPAPVSTITRQSRSAASDSSVPCRPERSA